MAAHCGPNNYTIVQEGEEAIANRDGSPGRTDTAWRVHYQCNGAGIGAFAGGACHDDVTIEVVRSGCLACLVMVTASACGRVSFDLLADGGDAVADGDTAPRVFGYLANQASTTITAVSVNLADGSLSETPGSPFELGGTPEEVAASATTLYVTTKNPGQVIAFHIDSTTGSLTRLNTLPCGTLPDALAVHPDGYLYVLDSMTPATYGFAIAADGSLAGIPGSPWSHGGGPAEVAIAIHPNGRWVYTLDENFPGAFLVYTVGAGGALTEDTSITWNYMATAEDIAIESSGRHGFLAPLGSAVPAFTIDPATGAVSTTPGSPFNGPNNSVLNIALDPTGQFLLLANNGSNTISAYAVAGTGALSPVSGSPINTGGSLIWDVATSPLGGYVYANDGDTLSVLHVDNTGFDERFRGIQFPGMSQPWAMTFVRMN